MAIAEAEGQLKGKQPQLSVLQRRWLLVDYDYDSGADSGAELVEISGLSRSATYASLAALASSRPSAPPWVAGHHTA
jgi:hypothetical protein